MDNFNERKKILKELFDNSGMSLLSNNFNDKTLLDDKSILPEELWAELADNINKSFTANKKEWLKNLRKEKMKILSFKYFTKTSLISLDELEEDIRRKVKRYFPSLESYTDEEDFMNKFFNLPKDLLFSFIRLILNSSKEINDRLSITKDELKEKIEDLKKLRLKTANKISFISNGNISVFNIEEIKELIDHGVIYEDNQINRGISEYVYKLTNHEVASEKIIEKFNDTFLKDLKRNIENTSSYINHVRYIKNEESGEFFDEGGLQLGRKFDVELEAVKNKDYADAVIDEKSVFKEPKTRIKSSEFAWSGDSNDDIESEKEGGSESTSSGGSSSSFSGGGGGTFSNSFDDGGISDIDSGGGDVGVEEDGTEMPKDDNGLPTDFGTQEDNGIKDEETTSEDSTDLEEE